MMGRPILYGVVAASALAGACAHQADKPDKFVAAATRRAALRRAQVWTHTDVAAMDIAAGPKEKGAFAPGDTIACTYSNEQLGGNTPKFACLRRGDEDRLKVRFGRDNGEVYAGVAATRLLWALGYGADAVYPVHVTCHGCPPAIADDRPSSAGETHFDVAAVERKFPGRDIVAGGTDGGWAWTELDQVDESAGGAPAAQRDALKLLAVFLQHSDSKAEQQRLVCVSETGDEKNKKDKKGKNDKNDKSDKKDKKDGKSEPDVADCVEPFLMIHDVGQTFGAANLFNRSAVGSVNFDRWSHTPVWKDAKRCIGNLTQSETGTLVDPPITEAGRQFLAGLLAQLTDDQLKNLFTVARFADKPHGGKSVEEWVAAFKHKRDEIAAASCPS